MRASLPLVTPVSIRLANREEIWVEAIFDGDLPLRPQIEVSDGGRTDLVFFPIGNVDKCVIQCHLNVKKIGGETIVDQDLYTSHILASSSFTIRIDAYLGLLNSNSVPIVGLSQGHNSTHNEDVHLMVVKLCQMERRKNIDIEHVSKFASSHIYCLNTTAVNVYDARSIMVPKEVLFLYSNFFRKMFYGGYEDSGGNVEITGITKEELHDLCEAIRHPDKRLSAFEACSLLRVAKNFGVTSITNQVEGMVVQPGTCISLLVPRVDMIRPLHG